MNALTDRRNKNVEIDDGVFLGRAAERLSTLIEDQSKLVFDAMGIVIPVRSCSLMTVLAKLEAASASDLARELGHSHQLVMQKIPKLARLGLIDHRNDEDDARRRIFYLTDNGLKQMANFEQCSERLSAAYQRLYAEVGDVRKLIDQTVNALSEMPLNRRL